HAYEVLQEDAAGADRQMPDFGIAHLTWREPHRLAGGVESRVGEGLPEPAEVGRAGEVDRVARTGRRTSPPVEDDERYERIAARQIAVNDSSSREAPPTSAPSMSACASNSPALSGLTEPP